MRVGLMILLLGGLAGCARAPLREPTAAELRRDGPELARAYLLGTEATPTSGSAVLTPWVAYGAALEVENPAAREQALQRVSSQSDSEALHALALRAISQDTAFQGRQAQFIRKYGFYANWFNRLVYSMGRVIQGNIQAVAQFGIDAAHDAFAPASANEYERRALDLLERQQRLSPGDTRTLNKLRARVDRALAEADVANAEYALRQGDPGTAVFYARQAAVRLPEWSKATGALAKAESALAAQRREALGSGQVGYPDRRPPVDLNPPEVLRALLADQSVSTTSLTVRLLTGWPAPGTGDALAYARWPELIHATPRGGATPAERRWAAALVNSPAHNRELRLEQAQAGRRGQLWHFIFIGSERAPERAYKTATWVNQTFDALKNVGVFYVFEVLGRAGQAVWSPPVPDDAVLEAQADWLRHAPPGHEARKQELARSMAATYRRGNRYEAARGVLTRAGGLDAATAAKLNTAEAKYWLVQSETEPTGRNREAMLARARALDKPLAEKRIAKMKPKKTALADVAMSVPWSTLQLWTGEAPPCGLPGNASWFAATGGATALAAPVLLQTLKTTETVYVTYTLRNGVRMTEASPIPVRWEALPAGIRRGFGLVRAEREAAEKSIQALDRLPIPFELGGGIGASGVDVAPRLLPLQAPGQDLELYK